MATSIRGHHAKASAAPERLPDRARPFAASDAGGPLKNVPSGHSFSRVSVTPPPQGAIAPTPLQARLDEQRSERSAQALQPPGRGKPLPPAVQAKMEQALSHDFSDVRIHEGPQAQSIGALAFTRGTDLHFAHGRYSPATQEGQKILGHELAHVVQQRQGRVRASLSLGGLPVNDEADLEREAEALGTQASRSGEVERAPTSAPPSGVRTRSSTPRATGAAPAQMIWGTEALWGWGQWAVNAVHHGGQQLYQQFVGGAPQGQQQQQHNDPEQMVEGGQNQQHVVEAHQNQQAQNGPGGQGEELNAGNANALVVHAGGALAGSRPRLPRNLQHLDFPMNQEAVDRLFRRLLAQHHPDRPNGGDGSMFRFLVNLRDALHPPDGQQPQAQGAGGGALPQPQGQPNGQQQPQDRPSVAKRLWSGIKGGWSWLKGQAPSPVASEANVPQAPQQFFGRGVGKGPSNSMDQSAKAGSDLQTAGAMAQALTGAWDSVKSGYTWLKEGGLKDTAKGWKRSLKRGYHRTAASFLEGLGGNERRDRAAEHRTAASQLEDTATSLSGNPDEYKRRAQRTLAGRGFEQGLINLAKGTGRTFQAIGQGAGHVGKWLGNTLGHVSSAGKSFVTGLGRVAGPLGLGLSSVGLVQSARRGISAQKRLAGLKAVEAGLTSQEAREFVGHAKSKNRKQRTRSVLAALGSTLGIGAGALAVAGLAASPVGWGLAGASAAIGLGLGAWKLTNWVRNKYRTAKIARGVHVSGFGQDKGEKARAFLDVFRKSEKRLQGEAQTHRPEVRNPLGQGAHYSKWLAERARAATERARHNQVQTREEFDRDRETEMLLDALRLGKKKKYASEEEAGPKVIAHKLRSGG